MSSTEWLVTVGVLGAVIVFDLILAIARRNKETTSREAIGWTLFYVVAAIAFGYLLPNWAPQEYRKEFIAGWLTEYSLSVDNLFVFIILLANLKIKKESQQLVLLYGIMIAIVLRVILIFLGVALVTRFTWVFFFFGGFLIFTAYKLVNEKEEVEGDEAKLVGFLRKRGFSNFGIALVALGVTDLIFALDSIPAILGLTTSSYVVITANIFALMGLRQLYFLLQGLMDRLIHLSRGLAFILAFIGVKMVLHAIHSLGVHVPEVSLELSLAVIITTLTVTAITSLYATRKSVK
ncbi:tellurite resistance protein TerC [Candidatus Planktophila sulfonica]|uniref:Tellurite resistance protein TerC n=1 Tax=Candidatus Planktophila sulfonica TaxID=1884904 RepID=A0A249KIH5_9ACTN|nr:tellurite resistance protein TerC [Candidatus Planktophila sulfonica]